MAGLLQQRGEVAGARETPKLPAKGGSLTGPSPLPPVPCFYWSPEEAVGRRDAEDVPHLWLFMRRLKMLLHTSLN